MPQRTITVSGDITDDDLRELIAWMKRIEARDPDKTIKMVVNDPESTKSAAEIMALMDKLNPLSPGYERTHAYMRRQRKN